MTTPTRPVYPLTLSQRRYLQLQLDHPDSYLDNVYHVYRVQGDLHIDALRSALTEIQKRYEILRTIYQASDPPMQKVVDDPQLHFVEHDFTTRIQSASDDESWITWVRDEGKRPFDLTRDLPLRCDVFRLGSQDHALLLTIHHIAYDFHSERILFQELQSLYTAFVKGQPVPDKVDRFQYREFALWQQAQLESEAWIHHVQWWLEQVGTNPPLLHLPYDVPTPRRSVIADQFLEQTLPSELVKRLKTSGKQQGITLFVQVFSTLGALLSQISGEREVVIGFPMSHRNSPAAERSMGLFTHSVAMRISLTDCPSFTELTRRTARNVAQAMKHRDVPAYALYPHMRGRDLSSQPLYRVRFNLLNLFYGPLELPGLTLTKVTEAAATNPDLGVVVWNRGADDVRVNWLYDKGLFSQNRVTRWMTRYQELLEQLATNPMAPLDLSRTFD
jgi:hypothetical protein